MPIVAVGAKVEVVIADTLLFQLCWTFCPSTLDATLVGRDPQGRDICSVSDERFAATHPRPYGRTQLVLWRHCASRRPAQVDGAQSGDRAEPDAATPAHDVGETRPV